MRNSTEKMIAVVGYFIANNQHVKGQITGMVSGTDYFLLMVKDLDCFTYRRLRESVVLGTDGDFDCQSDGESIVKIGKFQGHDWIENADKVSTI